MKKIFWPKYQLDGGMPRYGLERMQMFFDAMKMDETKLPPIFHITGTNGKGSTTAFIKYILEANGYLVHRFTSPHIVEWNERIEVSSKIITDEYANEVAQKLKDFADANGLQVSYFEGIFALASKMFSENPAVACVLEVGMGGRLDATNAFKNSLVSIITYISLDHCKTLGATRELIAVEKAGILKENGILIIGKQEQDALQVLLKNGKEKNNKIYAFGRDFNVEKTDYGFIFEGFGKTLKLPTPRLYGEHQIENAGGAIAALLAQDKIKISDESIGLGLKNTHWLGRLQNMSKSKLLQYLPKNTEFVIDGAHNDSGARVLKDWLLEQKKTFILSSNDDFYRTQQQKFNILITSMLSRKNSTLFINNLEKCFDLVLTIQMHDEEATRPPEDFKQEFISLGWNNVVAIDGNFIDALKYIKNNHKDNVRVVIAGSLHLMGEVLEVERDMGGEIY
ncbi:MAG: hypothetical protein LBT02_01965 [Rickettsiales bacterium]|jgi:dihydrofolate synthase/folylpolyglutamate synthase|nr:hypothetical protein [Rickettsiales bacterium]